VTDRSPAGIVPHQNDAKDRAGILDVLERFRLAYTAKNEQGVSAVYPDVRTDRMFRDMRDCARVSLVFGEARVNVLSPSEAQVRVPATYGCSPTTAERPMVSPQETDVYMFARRSGVWVIESRLTPVDRKKP
jgi:hypothetical protein